MAKSLIFFASALRFLSLLGVANGDTCRTQFITRVSKQLEAACFGSFGIMF